MTNTLNSSHIPGFTAQTFPNKCLMKITKILLQNNSGAPGKKHLKAAAEMLTEG